MTTYYTTSNGDFISSITYNMPGYRELLKREPMSLEELQEQLREYPGISHVAVPHSYYGYGAPLAYLANGDYLDMYYSDVVVQRNLEYLAPREVILAGEHAICELFEPDYWEHSISLDDDATYERRNAALVEELERALKDKLTELGKEFTDEGILFCADNGVLDYPEDIFIDNDGFTPYVSETVVDTIAKGYSNDSH